MFKGRSVFLLDLISNSLGAVLLLFLLLISRHFERPPPRVEGTLLVMAEAAREDARIGVWAEPPGERGRRLFTEDITGLVWNSETGRYRPLEAGPQGPPLDAFGAAAKFLRSPEDKKESESGAAVRAGAGVIVPRPAKGCWIFGPFYEDTPSLAKERAIDTEIRLKVWFRGLLQPEGAEGAAAKTRFRAPTSQTRHCVEVTDSGAVGSSGCCREPPAG